MISPFDEIDNKFEVEAFLHDLINHQTLIAFLEKTRTSLTNNDWPLIILFYNSFFCLPESQIAVLNSFAESIDNPMLFCTGANLTDELSCELKFKLSNLRYFEFESKTVWETRSKNLIEFCIDKTKKFLFASTKDYPTRKFLLANLINNGYMNDGYIGYARKVITDYSYELDNKNAEVSKVANSIDHIFPLPDIDNHYEWVNMDENIRTNSYLNIVTDTFYHLEPNILFLSEKIFNAMVFGQMFMYLGPAGTLKYLRTQGYETFAEFIDESYDEIYDPYLRLVAFNKSMLNFVSKPIEEIKDVYVKVLPKLIKNRTKLFDSNFKQLVLEDLESAKFYKNK